MPKTFAKTIMWLIINLDFNSLDDVDEEIAKVQNCPIGTVRSRIFKGRELINETFSKLGLSKTWSN